MGYAQAWRSVDDRGSPKRRFRSLAERAVGSYRTARIVTRILRLEEGNPGDSRGVGGGVMELRISYGPGYRVYFVMRNQVLVILLCGGDKSSQTKDIERAKTLAAMLETEE